MINIIVTMDGKADITKFAKNLKTNIRRSQNKLVRRLTRIARVRVMADAPEWRGTLKNRVAMKVFPRAKRGEVMMASPLYDMIGQANEFNIRGRRKLYKSAYPKLAEWASDKGVFGDKPFVIVGGQHTRLGTVNKFFTPAFNEVQRQVPQVTAIIIAETLRKTRA